MTRLETSPLAGSAAPTTGNYKWALVAMLWLICFFNYADRQAISSVLPILEQDFGFSKEEQGVIGGAFMWIYGLSAPLAGLVGDRFSRKRVILSGLYVWSAITGLTAVCGKVWQFALVRGAEGLGETFYFPASMSLVSDYHGKQTRSRAMALHQTGVYAGIIGGGVLTAWWAEKYGWRFPFVVFGVAGVLLGLVLALFVREAPRNQAERAEENLVDSKEESVDWIQFVGKFLTTPATICLLLAFVGANTVSGVFYVWMTTFLKNKFNMQLAGASFAGTVSIQIPSMIGAITGGFLADAWRRRWLGGRVGVQALGIVLGTPMILLSGLATTLEVALAGMVVLGFAKGIYDSNIWASLYDVVPAARRSSAVGLTNMVGWIFAGMGSWGLGRMVDQGTSMSHAIAYTAVIYAGVAVLLLAAAVIFAPRAITQMGGSANAS